MTAKQSSREQNLTQNKHIIYTGEAYPSPYP